VAANVAADARTIASNLRRGVLAEPSSRLPTEPALLDVLSTYLAIAPARPAAANISPPASPPTILTENEPIIATLEPNLIVDRSMGEASLAAPQSAPTATPVQGLAQPLLAQQITVEVSAPMVGMGALRQYWPFDGAFAIEDGQEAAVVAAIVAAALVAVTALAAAGAGLSGRPLRHTAWRQSLARRRQESDWNTLDEDDKKAPAQPTETPIRWPGGRTKEAGVAVAMRQMRSTAATPIPRRVA
jgi:hypothetical protein